MSESTIYKLRRSASGRIIGCVDLVYSPDDDGWYADENDLVKLRRRGSRIVYRTQDALEKALRDQTHRWEKWS